MKNLKTIIRYFTIFILLLLAIFGLFLLIATLREYHPEPIEFARTHISSHEEECGNSDTISLISWNIGYSGLSYQMDFFYEGGSMVRPDKDILNENLTGIGKFLSSLDSIDFILLQEVDISSKRSWYRNQLEYFQELMPERSSAFAKNYKADYVPIPPKEPMGKVKSGMAVFSCLHPDTSLRISLPGSYTWPVKLFQLKRCFIKQYYTLADGKKLCLINIHNSAFDDASGIRASEMEMIRQLVVSEYESGNYVIAGGDWNINPPGLDETYQSGDAVYFTNDKIIDSFMPEGWKWVFDKDFPTNRKLNMPFVKGETECGILDFYLCSPNVEAVSVKTFHKYFRYSDHNPVFLKVVLK